MSRRGTGGGRARGPPLPAISHGERPDGLERSYQHLRHLYEVSTVLTRFQTVEKTVPEVVDVLARSLPLRSAIFILEAAGGGRTIAWQSEGGDADRLRAARTHAQNAYRYLVSSGVDLERDQAAARLLPASGPVVNGFVILPLVVGRGPIFGAFQVEAGVLGEEDVVFLNALVNQLAIAIDRQAAIDARQANAELRAREQRVLADASAAAGSSLERLDVQAALTRALVPQLADLCILEELADDGAILHREVAAAGETERPVLAELMRRLQPRALLRATHAQVAASRRSILAADVADLVEEAGDLRAAGIRSLICMPLLSRGKVLGVLTLATAGSGRRYSAHDLALAEELARRAAIAMDNANLYEQARQATEARENLLAIVSHDLKSPLGVILMNLGMLLKARSGEDAPRTRQQLEFVQRSAVRMRSMIEDLLDTASIEAGQFSIKPRRLPVAPLVSETLETLQPLGERKSVQLTSDVAPGLPAIQADEARLQQVLANVVGNAIKFTPKGGAILLSVVHSGDSVRFTVADTGPGIPQEDLLHVFDRYWKGGRQGGQGTGLGLFIVKRIVEAHGGRVWVESRAGEGSAFSFSIPVAPPSQEADQALAREGPVP